MSEAPSSVDDLLSEAALRRVDDACVRFEDSWRKGQRPRLGAFLAGTQDPERTELLRELLRLDIHYREGRGEAVSADDYEAHFPQDVALIRAVCAEGMTVAPATPAARPDRDTLRPRASVETMSDLATADLPEAPGGPTPSAAAVTPALPTVPGYEILGLLGRGGMGVVYQARQTSLKRLVALKMILAGHFASPQELARFRAEAEVIARLRHPNIVQIYEIGEERGCPFFSLEFVEGGSLDRRVRGTPQPPRPAAGLVAVLARAMHVAHQSGVVHRDLKPANVLIADCRLPNADLSEQSKIGNLQSAIPKITDFGLAKRLDSDSGQTHSGAIMGTPSYMAPEQAEGRVKEVGPAADVYSLAAILYELLTGRPPFKGATPRETIEQVCTREPVPVRQLQPSVPRDLETICLKGLRKDARQRYPSAADLADDLHRWLDGRPILARPVPAWERAWKWARRRPALAGLALAVSVALVSLAAGGVLFGQYKGQQLARGQAIHRLVALGQEAETAGRLETAREQWLKAQSNLETDPGAADEETTRLLHESLQRVEGRLKEQEDRLQEERQRQGRLADRQKFEERRKSFEGHRDRALLHAVSPREPEAVADAAVVRREAAAALAELGLDAAEPQGLAAGLTPYRPLFETPAQLNLLAEECVEVLLAWAEAEAPRPALRLLDAAALLARTHEFAAPRTLHLRRAKCLELLGEAAAARAERQQADGIAPATAFDYFEAALASYRAGRVAEASAACAKAVKLQPDHFWAHYVKALCNLREQRWGEAEVELGICLGRRPDYRWLLSLRGTAYGQLKAFDKAEADFRQALEDSSDAPFRAAALVSRSAVRLLQGRRDDAEHDMREAIKLQPDAYQGYVNLARLLEDRGDRVGALAQLDLALARRPDNPMLYSERARLHAQNGDRPSARRDFERVIAGEPPGSASDRVVAARVELAHLRGLAGDNAAALAECDAVLAVRKDYAEAYRQRAEILLALKRNKEAGEALDRYLQVGGKPTPAMHKSRGLLHAQQRDYRAAVEAYTNALLLKEDAETLSYRGWAYLMQEAARPALDDFDAALRLDPKHSNALSGRGTALVMRARPADVAGATAAAEQSLRVEPRTVPRLMACARIYARAAAVMDAASRSRAGQPEADRCRQRALALLREAIKMVPETERLAFWRDGVLAEPVLLSLRSPPGMTELGRVYGR